MVSEVDHIENWPRLIAVLRFGLEYENVELRSTTIDAILKLITSMDRIKSPNLLEVLFVRL